MRAIPLFLLIFALPALAGEEEARLKAQATELAGRIRSKDHDDRIAAIRESASVHHPAVVGPLTKCLKDKDIVVRFEAIAALGLRDDPKDRKKAAQALAQRIKPLDGNEAARDELLKVVTALHDLAETVSIKPLLSDMKENYKDREMMRARLLAVGNVPHADAIDAIIKFAAAGGRGHKRHRDAARAAIVYATGERNKGDVDAWRSWWKDNKRTFDFEAAAEKRAAERNKRKEQQEKKNARKNKKKRKKGNAEG